MRPIEEDLFKIGYLLDHTFPDYIHAQDRVEYLKCWILLVKIKTETKYY